MYQETLTAGQTSAPQAAGIGSVARLTISSGSGYVEYTTGSFADIGNNVATWTTWPKGTVGATAQDTAGFPMIVRFTCVTGTAAVMLADPSDAEFPSNALMPWESMQPSYAYDASGNITGLLGPDSLPLYPSVNLLTQLQLKKWRAALANTINGASNSKIAFVGDSTTGGTFGSGSQYTDNRPFAIANRVAALLNGRGITAGVGNTFGDQQSGNASAQFLLYDTRWTFGAGWRCDQLSGIAGGNALTHNTASTAAANFTPVAAFDRIDVWTVTNPAYQPFSVAVDGGGALATITNTAATSILKTTVSTTDATHTINFAKTAANANLAHILAVDTYRSSVPSVQCWNMGYAGATSAIWGTTTSSVWLAPNLLATYAPDLTVICLGINDWIAAVSSATFQANMQVLINKALLSGDVILVTPPPTQIGYSGTTQANMDLIRDAVFSLSVTNNCPVVDIFGRFVSYTDANAYGYYGDGAHPDKTGYQDWANALVSFIAP